jgi:arginyl-tRNA synthetase
VIKEKIEKLISSILMKLEAEDLAFNIEKPRKDLGDFSCNVAFLLAKQLGKNPKEAADMVASEINKDMPEELEKIEVVNGYINFFLKQEYLQKELLKIAEDKNFGVNDTLKGKTVMVEYTDPNPFKLFHIGHLMSNTIGESVARLYEASGAKVIRANYQGDVGLHVAKAVWGMLSNDKEFEDISATDVTLNQRIDYLGKKYAFGATSFEAEERVKNEVQEINEKIYNHSDKEIDKLYNWGKKISLEYFETIYNKLGTKFNEYFFESERGKEGLEMVLENPKIFKKSDGAMIFKGEDYGLHTRVFVNSKGLPTYEAKELGLNKKKFELYPLDLSIIITGNEIDEYFKVLLKVMELIMPEVAEKTVHVSHGMLRLPTGKMSSRTGDVITAESLIDETKSRLKEKSGKEIELTEEEKEVNSEEVAIGAIKYSILRQAPGHDIIFDFDKSLSLEGDSGPYAQYAYARLRSILSKAENHDFKSADTAMLKETSELGLIKQLLDFPEVVKESSENLAPHHLIQYVHELASAANYFYESIRILTDEDIPRRQARLVLVETVAATLKTGLTLLGIKVPEKI